MSLILEKIAILGIIALIGFLAAKFNLIRPEIKDAIGKLIMKITLPLLIVTTIPGLDLTGGMLKNGLLVLLFAYILLFILLGLGKLESIVFRMKDGAADVQTALSAFGNVIFLGFPLMTALFPENGLFYAIFFYLASDSLVWTFGVYLMGRQTHSGSALKTGLKHLLNPNTAAFVIGLGMLALRLKFPAFLQTALNLPGSMTTPLSMLFIGATLAAVSLKGILKRWRIAGLAVVKMILVPIAALFAVTFLNTALGLGMDNAAISVLVLQTAMPCMTIFAILSKELGSDHVYAAEAIFVTTVLSLATLPGILFVIERVLI